MMASASRLGRSRGGRVAAGRRDGWQRPMSLTLGPQIATLFILVFARVGTLVMLMPGLGRAFLPAVRLSLALFLTLAMMPMVQPLLPPAISRPDAALAILLLEIAVALMIGLTGASRRSRASRRRVISSRSPLASPSPRPFDPTQGGQAAASRQLPDYSGIPSCSSPMHTTLSSPRLGGATSCCLPAKYRRRGDAARLALDTMAKGFGISVQIAAPFIVFAIIFNVGLGVLSRLMPSLQVFFLAMPATIMLGFLILAAVLGLMMSGFPEGTLLSSNRSWGGEPWRRPTRTTRQKTRPFAVSNKRSSAAMSPRASRSTPGSCWPGGTLAVLIAGGNAADGLTASLRGLLANAHRIPADAGGLRSFGEYVLLTALGAVAVPLTILMISALAGGLVQHRPLFTTEPLAPKFSRLSPLAGFKRVFGKEAFVQFLKGLLKLGRRRRRHGLCTVA